MKKIKWGVIGTAGIARSCTIPGMLQAENCELYAIAGRNIGKAEQFKEEFGFEKVYGSYKELLEDMEVEAVYITLPNTLHYEWAVKAMGCQTIAGKVDRKYFYEQFYGTRSNDGRN